MFACVCECERERGPLLSTQQGEGKKKKKRRKEREGLGCFHRFPPHSTVSGHTREGLDRGKCVPILEMSMIEESI